MALNADTRSPRDVFDGRTHYEIPPFQRPYVWDEEQQWAPLWADITRVAEQLVAAGTDMDAWRNAGRHFLGAVVYESQPPVVGDVTRHLIIDGQQRTTTLQIILNVVHDVILQRGHETMAEDLEALIRNKGSAFKDKPERFKLWPSKTDRDAFERAIDDASSDDSDHRIAQAHRFFRSETEDWVSGQPDADGEVPPGTEDERVLGLCTTLQDRLTIVAINISADDDSQLIFETLNDRGTPLLKADLIKNWVFRAGDKIGADVDTWPERYWGDFDDDWWRKEIVQGRHSRARIDIFLQYWLTMRLRDEVTTDQIFRHFRTYADQTMTDPAHAEGLLSEMRADADTFRNFAELPGSSTEGRFYANVIETMELAATSPLLLRILSRNYAVPQDQVEVALIALESWVIRRTLVRATMKDVNKMMVALLKRLDEVPPSSVGEAVREWLSSQTADARIWPTDARMKADLPDVRLYGNVRQNRLRVVLSAVEMQLRSDKSEKVSLPEKLEVEHVMPKGWRDFWDTTPPLGPDAAAERDQNVDRLGNLTLTSKKLNGSLSNRPWTDGEAHALGGRGADSGLGKRSLLEKYSLLLLSKGLTSDHPEAWTDADIAERSKLLTRMVCEIWPAPDKSASTLDGEPQADASVYERDEQSTSRSDRAHSAGPRSGATADDRADGQLPGPDFTRAMKDVYFRAKHEADYNATIYLRMLSENGPLETAKKLLRANGASDGFTALWERGRLDLTVENVVLQPQFANRFSDEERQIARERLRAYGFEVER